jgi:hypothetical protein
MKFRNYLVVFVTAFAATFFLASCLNEENKIPENCYDGILNNGEFLLDCGGANCPACDHCIDGIWQPEQGETCIDCGGECGPCPQCRNCIQDADETGIDCGGTNCGPCSALCGDGLLNGTETEVDCGGLFCDACPTCVDQEMNGTEIGIDCGGVECPPCTTDGSCINGALDGDEWWVDCAGSSCPDCDTILSWTVTNVSHVVPPTGITAAESGTLTAGGTSLQLGNIALSITPPGGVWAQGTSIPVGPTSGTANSISYSIGGVTYSSNMAGASGTIAIQRYVAAPNFFRVTFNGVLKNIDGTGGTITVQNGVFMKVVG